MNGSEEIMWQASYPVLSSEQARSLEERLFRGDEGAEWTAMQSAGKGIADALASDLEELVSPSECRTLLVLAGKGHNGGDALIASRHLLERFPGCRADLVFPFGTTRLRPLTARAYRELSCHFHRIRLVARLDAMAAAYDVSIDGVFGFQFRPPIEPDLLSLFASVESRKVGLRAAVDLPSGLGEAGALCADFTYATGSVKAPLLAGRHRSKH